MPDEREVVDVVEGAVSVDGGGCSTFVVGSGSGAVAPGCVDAAVGVAGRGLGAAFAGMGAGAAVASAAGAGVANSPRGGTGGTAGASAGMGAFADTGAFADGGGSVEPPHESSIAAMDMAVLSEPMPGPGRMA